MPTSEDPRNAEGMTLEQLIVRQKGLNSYEDLAVRSEGRLTRGTWHALANPRRPLKNFPDPITLQTIAETLGVSLRSVVLAAARSAGLDVSEHASHFAQRLPAGVDNLDDHEQLAVLTLVRSLVELHAQPEGGGKDVSVNLRGGETEITVARSSPQVAASMDPAEQAKQLPKVAKRASATDKARRAARDQHAE